VVHRLLKRRLASLGRPAGGFSPLEKGPALSPEELQRIASEASFAERKAMEVEREVVDLYRSFFMRDRVGDVLDGTISGVASFGAFVAADQPFVEGLVRTEHLLPDDFYDYDEVARRLVGRRSGRTFSLGDPVKVEVLSASVARRQVDLRLHGDRAPIRREPRPKGERREKPRHSQGKRPAKTTPRRSGRAGKRRR
jgi:ribonuclease R